MGEGSEVWLIRHAESEANVSAVWQGRGESPLTDLGRQQTEALGRRLQGTHFDLVITSPLQRARQTSEVLGPAEVEPAFVEIDLGHWEGKSWSELAGTDLSELEALKRGEDIRFGEVGETLSELRGRVLAALARVFDRLPSGGKAAIVTHGGVLDVVVERAFGRLNGRRLAGFPENTAITRLIRRHGRDRLASFNDGIHLAPRPAAVERALEEGRAVLAMIRHARTTANHVGRWQGHSDFGLDEIGVEQATLLGRSYPGLQRVVTSPLGRAWQTALHLHAEPETHPALIELGFGKWEGLTSEEIRLGWPELFERIFIGGEDLARGETGETWQGLTGRIAEAIDSLKPEPGQVTGVVTHGAAIRAYLSALVGSDWRRAQEWDTPANGSVTHLVMHDHGPQVADYGAAGYLEER
ncbi:MAG TPA: histidine phosphatase family protein [Acidimicrobiia bacterium]|nr:histidine phosphatase family protein [Acidimicrobiia bacterium]